MLPWTPPASLTLSLQQQQNHYGSSGGQDAVSSPMQQGGHQPPPSQQQLQHHQAQQQQHGQMQSHMNVQVHHQQPHQQGQPQHIQQQQQLGPSPQQLNGPPTGGAALAAPINLGQVLHFLQTEWRRYERERNEWEIERGEMRARIALLEGERRGNENLKTDLMRRVKMLEYALRQERQKYLAHQQAQAQVAAQQASKDKERAKSEEPSKRLEKDDKAPEKTPASAIDKKKANLLGQAGKEPSINGRASPALSMATSIGDEMEKSVNSLPEVVVSAANVGGLTRPSSTLSLNSLPQGMSALPNGVAAAAAMTNGQPLAGALGALGWNPSLGRDPRGRAKSREYLKQCLQEITYLTSVTALNPLPEKTVAGMSRPRKAVVEMPVIPGGQAFAAVPSTNGREAGDAVVPGQSDAQTDAAAVAPDSRDARVEGHSEDANRSQQSQTLEADTTSRQTQANEGSSRSAASAANARDSPLSRVEEVPEHPQPATEGGAALEGNAQSQVADASRKAAYAPISPKTALSPLLPEGQSGRHRSESTSSTSSAATLVSDAHKTWRAKRTLRAHLDSVRCLAFDRVERPTDVVVASGSDDCSIKLWRMAPLSLASATRSMTLPDSDPFHTFRGHAAPVTALVISAVSEHLYSASLDCTVGIWYMPSRDADLYAPFDEGSHIYKLEGHTDAIWDVCILASNVNNSTGRLSEVVASASADKTVKIWHVESRTSRDGRPTSQLRLSLSAAGVDGDVTAKSPIPTCITLCQSDMTRLAVGYSDGIVRIFDIETGRLLLSSKPDPSGSSPIQVNRLVSHPTLPLLVTGHEDGYIRLIDLKNGNCSHTIQAHSDAVTAIDIDPAGLNLTSASHDGVIRFWDLLQTRTCLQDIQNTHRAKGDEGVLDVRFHPSLPFVASAGADGNVRIYG